MTDWELKFKSWSQPISQSESEKCERAERMIKKAIDNSDSLRNKTIKVFSQGSYRNSTNIKQESDVDICVCCYDVFFPDYRKVPNINGTTFGFMDSVYKYSDFKNDVGKALINYFGKSSIKRGNKAFDVHENASRVDADVVPAFQSRVYYPGQSIEKIPYKSGTQLISDENQTIRNFPNHHYEEGIHKNKLTNQRFKKLVRILKNLKNEMNQENILEAKDIPSYLIECLVWNVPDSGFSHPTLQEDVRYVLAHFLNNSMIGTESSSKWREINNIKPLFSKMQPWSIDKAHQFISKAWDYIGFQ